MIYAMSDLHGCYDKYEKMLKRINFSDGDTLYVLGDVVDRGPDGIKLLFDLMERKNVVVLRGNHDHTAYFLLKNATMRLDSPSADQIIEIYTLWLADGGSYTVEAFRELNDSDRKKFTSYLKYLPFFEEITVAGQNFFLAHTVPGKEKMQDLDSCTLNDFLIGQVEYDKEYFPDKYLVTGHTPTGLIDKNYSGRIYRKNRHIAIDCGAVFKNTLGCICLDTLEEFYV